MFSVRSLLFPDIITISLTMNFVSNAGNIVDVIDIMSMLASNSIIYFAVCLSLLF